MTANSTKAGRREWIGLAVIALPCLLYSMDLSVLNLAVPELSANLRPSGNELLWIVDIYGFLVAGSLVTMGTLGDRIGRRRLLMIGAGLFGAASVLAAFAWSAETLIAARALLGIAGGTLAPSTMSLIRNMFHDPHERTVAIGLWIAAYSVGGAIGPLVGGVLLEWFWWGSVFLVAVPVMALLLAVGPTLLPESRNPDAGRLDLASAALSIGATLAVIYGFKEMAVDGLAPPAVAALAGGLALGATFVRRQARLADPLLDLSLFRIPALSAALLTNLLGFFAVFAAMMVLAQYLQIVLGLSPLEAGLWSLPLSGGFVVGAMLTPRLARVAAPANVIGGGLALGAAGLAVLSQVGDSLAVLVAGSVLLSLGIAPVATLSTELIVGSAPPERAGSAAGISETGAELGGALGIALLGSLGAAIFRGRMDDAGASAADTPGEALEASRELGGPAGAELLDAARDAFTGALQVTALTSAAVLAAAAALALVLLRRARPAEAAGALPEPAAA